MSVEVDWSLYLIVFISAGAASGFAGGLFGIGGGLLRIPMFLYIFPIFGFSPVVLMHMAAGTSLALSIPTSYESLTTHHRNRNLDVAFLYTWIPGLLVGVLLGLVGMRASTGRVLMVLFAVLLGGAAAPIVVGGRGFFVATEVPRGITRVLIGVTLGALSSMVGLSGGTFVGLFLNACRVPIRRAIAIASASAFAISIVGTVGSIINGMGAPDRPGYALGYVEVPAVLVMTPAVMLGARLGARLGDRISSQRLRYVFGLFLLAVAADMVVKVLRGFGS